MKNYKDILALESNLIAMEKAIDNITKREHCQNCHKLIEDYDDVEFTGDEVIYTYQCECGRCAEVHYTLQYGWTHIIE